MSGGGRLSVHAPDGVGEVVEGDDLAALLLKDTFHVEGDVVTVTSKVVSKAEGRRGTGDRSVALDGETQRVVARRGPTSIVRNRLGLTMAAAGIDNSNVTAGEHLLLPLDPDASARAIRERIFAETGINVAVLVTDTAGRAWRTGQTDIAVGAAGLVVLEEYAGQVDSYGNPLAVTAPAVADELASMAELASGKLGGRPFAVIRGRSDLVHPAGEHGSGAGILNRADGEDLFGLGAREAVVAALVGRDRIAFGSTSFPEDLIVALAELADGPVAKDDAGMLVWTPETDDFAALLIAVRAVAHAHGWRPEARQDSPKIRFLQLIP